jgi:hypothetical protein
LNIKFEIKKISDSKYELSFHSVNKKFIEKLKIKEIICVSFKDKRIFSTNSWEYCKISDECFSFYLYDLQQSLFYLRNTKIESSLIPGENFLVLNLNIGNKQIIDTNIEDFDKIFIKAIKVLSDTYNNYI